MGNTSASFIHSNQMLGFNIYIMLDILWTEMRLMFLGKVFLEDKMWVVGYFEHSDLVGCIFRGHW